MQTDTDVITVQVYSYVSPECTCKIEDMVKNLPHVVESSFDQINGVLKVRVHKGMTSASNIAEELKKCSVNCGPRTPARDMNQMEHGVMKMKKPPARHNHHAMMASEFKRHFAVATVFTIPVLVLSPSIQRWVGYSLPQSLLWDVLLLVMALIVVLYGGFPFYRRVPA